MNDLAEVTDYERKRAHAYADQYECPWCSAAVRISDRGRVVTVHHAWCARHPLNRARARQARREATT